MQKTIFIMIIENVEHRTHFAYQLFIRCFEIKRHACIIESPLLPLLPFSSPASRRDKEFMITLPIEH